MNENRKCADFAIGFNPLAGIRCFLTYFPCKIGLVYLQIRFNPLAGIRCFLTASEPELYLVNFLWFQSPSGDSLFSDDSFPQVGRGSFECVSIP